MFGFSGRKGQIHGEIHQREGVHKPLNKNEGGSSLMYHKGKKSHIFLPINQAEATDPESFSFDCSSSSSKDEEDEDEGYFIDK